MFSLWFPMGYLWGIGKKPLIPIGYGKPIPHLSPIYPPESAKKALYSKGLQNLGDRGIGRMEKERKESVITKSSITSSIYKIPPPPYPLSPILYNLLDLLKIFSGLGDKWGIN